jgi:3-oxoacyl-[acyl-carrier-protein] synthase II
MRRVAVTGMGCVTPLGLGVAPTWEALKNGRSGIGSITLFDASNHDVRIAGEVRGFDVEQYVPRKVARRMDRYVQFALAATKEAVADSGLDIVEENADRIGVIIGSGIGGIATWEREHTALLERGPSRVSAFFIPMMISNMASGQVAMEIGAKGPNMSVVTACATAAHAICVAAQIIERGDATAIIAGGSEAGITPLAVAGFANMKALSAADRPPAEACRPFDKDHDGFVIAEGSGMVVLEDFEAAKRRGAPIHAELAGFGMSADAYHVTQPDPEGDGARRAIGACLASAGLSVDDIDYINAHAPGTPAGDRSEAKVLASMLGPGSKTLVSSTKSMHGHLLGAAGAAELITSILAIRDGVVPPTINHVEPDPECVGFDCVPNEAREHPVRVAVSNSFGFGGQNATLLVRAV